MLVACIVTLVAGVVVGNLVGMVLLFALARFEKTTKIWIMVASFFTVIAAVSVGIIVFEWQKIPTGWLTVGLAAGLILLNDIQRFRANLEDPTQQRLFSLYGSLAGLLLMGFVI
jgi:hypothetical protein